MEAGRLKALLRLYPRSWRRRYGREMEVLLEQMPAEIGVGLDLVLGAGTAYASVIRGNRILSACGAYLHGVAVAVLLQGIAFVTFILVAETSSPAASTVQLGPVRLIVYFHPLYFGLLRPLEASLWFKPDWIAGAVVLVVLLGALAFLVTAPRLVRSPR